MVIGIILYEIIEIVKAEELVYVQKCKRVNEIDITRIMVRVSSLEIWLPVFFFFGVVKLHAKEFGKSTFQRKFKNILLLIYSILFMQCHIPAPGIYWIVC